MRNRIHTTYRIAAFVTILAFMVSISAQNVTSHRTGLATTTPISNTVVQLRFTFPDGQSKIVHQLEGALIRIEKDGQIYGFTPYITTANNGQIACRVYRINTIQRNGQIIGEHIVEVSTISLGKDAITISDIHLQPTIQLIGMSKSSGRFSKTSSVIDSQPIVDTCCVTCNGVRSCACAVSASCGKCCIGDCCD